MSKERRRYFRIDETIGISYEILNYEDATASTKKHYAPDVLDMVSSQDKQIQQLLLEVSTESPKVAKLVALFNQKLERVVNQLLLETNLTEKIARKVKEANVSACGIAFENDEGIPSGSRLSLELTFYPDEFSVQTRALVVSCEPSRTKNRWYWRIDFLDMSHNTQEMLIQHIVQSQSAQLRKRRG
ncbi:MAG: PilZ domain-containing protein [Alteromonadaceae bacterium]|nr:MAG: PilZ domain-containing protein [Alteromonadaceae bacterium]